MAKRDDLRSLVQPAVESMGYTCWGVQFNRGRHRAFVRILIDGDNGVTLGDCERVNKRLSVLFDVEDPIRAPYTLEVSSPGINRPLLHPSHYRLYLGHEVSIRCYASVVDERKNFIGILDAWQENSVCLQVGDEKITIPFNMIKHANLNMVVNETRLL